jgi:hypothetical protein
VTPELFAASARPPTLIGAVAVPTFLRRETRWTGPVPKSFASVHGKPPLQFEGEPVWAEFIVLRLLARAGWQRVWVKNWKGQAFWRDVMDPVELPADQAALFARIAQNSRDMRLETRKAAMGRWGGGCWDVFAWRGEEVLFVESKQHKQDCVRETQRIWLDSARAEGVSGFAIIESKAD